MNFPHRPTRAPIYDEIGPVKLVRARVVYVDTSKYRCTVIDETGGTYEGIQVMPVYVNTEGGGIFWMPEVNSIVWLLFPSVDRVPMILGGCAQPAQLGQDDESDPNDFRMNRPVLNEGDMELSSKDGNFLIMRRGGVIEVGATQVAQRVYIPLSNVIRDLCENYELLTTGGKLSFRSRREDESHGQLRTPVELRLQLKEFAQDDPIIDLGLGRIAEEDDERVVNGKLGGVIARILINNRFRYWVDRDGNVQSYVHGRSTHSYNSSRSEFTQGSFFEKIRGVYRTVAGNRVVETKQSDQLTVRRDRVVAVGGDLQETVTGSVKRVAAHITEEVQGGLDRVVEGTVVEQVVGSKNEFIGDEYHRGVGTGSHVKVGGRSTLFIANSQKEDEAGGITVAIGDYVVHNILGELRISSGLTQDKPLAEIRVKPSGAIKVISTQGVAVVEVNNTGVRIKTAAGEISLDNAGTVNLGPPGRGLVVTTLTHPVDFVTGAPILGSISVAAGGLPGIQAVKLASTFTPDSS